MDEPDFELVDRDIYKLKNAIATQFASDRSGHRCGLYL